MSVNYRDGYVPEDGVSTPIETRSGSNPFVYTANRSNDSSSSRKEQDKFGTQEWLAHQFELSGLPESYRNAFMNNPGVAIYNSIGSNHGGGWLLHNMGFNTGKDKAKLDAKAQAFTYIQQLIDKYQDDRYNSALSMTGREAAAGINSSLNGGPDSAESVGLSNPAVDPAISDNLSPAASDISSIAGLASSVMQFRQMAIQMKMLEKQSRSVGLSNTDDIINIARDAAEDSITPAMFDNFHKDGQNFLDSSLIVGDALAKSYGFENPVEIKAFNTAFNAHFNSVFTKNSSYDAFVSGLQSRYRHASFAYKLEHNAPDIEADLAISRLEIERKYANLESDLLKSNDFTKLFKDERFASLRASLSESLLSSAEDDLQRSALEQFIASGGTSEISSEMLQSLKASISQELALQKEAELAAKDADAMLAFLAGDKPLGSSSRESRRRKRFARRQSRTRYGESGYYRNWHGSLWNSATSWLDAGNYSD